MTSSCIRSAPCIPASADSILGFERAGFQIRWQVELDSFCRSALQAHWPDVHRETDARLVRWKTLEPVDVIAAGFPCQDLSDAGKRIGLSGERSSLWWMVRRATRLLRPNVLVVENVRGLLSRGFGTVLGSLSRIGFDAEWQVIRASDIGAPHRRARLFLIAYPSMADANDNRCERGRETYHANRSEPSWNEPHGCGSFMANAMRGRRSRSRTESTHGNAWTPTPSYDFPAPPGDEPQAWEDPRIIKSRLAPLFDGVPSAMVGSCGSSLWRRKAIEAIGNAIVPQVSELVALRVLELLEQRDGRA